jgi:hypothetical protein
MLDNPELDSTMLADTLESLECAIEEKAQGIAVITSQLNADADYIDQEIKRLQARKKSIDGNVERIKAYLQSQLEAMGKEKIKTPTHTISIRQNPPSLVIDDEKLIPAKYLTVIPRSFKPNNADIKEALKAGKKVKGCRLASGKRLEIK